jgi:hypothetical protein
VGFQSSVGAAMRVMVEINAKFGQFHCNQSLQVVSIIAIQLEFAEDNFAFRV